MEATGFIIKDLDGGRVQYIDTNYNLDEKTLVFNLKNENWTAIKILKPNSFEECLKMTKLLPFDCTIHENEVFTVLVANTKLNRKMKRFCTKIVSRTWSVYKFNK